LLLVFDLCLFAWISEEKKNLSEMTTDNTISTMRNICRRVQKDIEDVLAARGVTEKLQFAPKLKEQVCKCLRVFVFIHMSAYVRMSENANILGDSTSAYFVDVHSQS
jgi:hypothetical protein